MLVLSRVCAEFHDHTGAVVHRVTPETRLTFREAPESIREDPLFRMLINDDSLEAAPSAAQKKQLEAEPLEGVNAEGRRIAAPGGGNSGDPEVNRNKRSPQCGVALIEVADRRIAAPNRKKTPPKEKAGLDPVVCTE